MTDQCDHCARLHEIVRTLPSRRFPVQEVGMGVNGVYFIFERGEQGHGGDRIVRVGCHTGEGNLASRLSEHLKPNKDRSIFRKNVGCALLAKGGDPYLSAWNLCLTSRKNRDRYSHLVDAKKQADIERAVSQHIQEHCSVRAVPIPTQKLAESFEKLCIGTISLCSKCVASDSWLGNSSPKEKIRDSGLWQVNELHKRWLSSDDLQAIESFVRAS